MSSQEFGKKYPFIKPNVYRSDSKELLKRVTEEASAANRKIADVVETSPDYMAICCARTGLFQEHTLAGAAALTTTRPGPKAKTACLRLANRELYISLGYNTKLIAARRCAEDHQRSSRSQMEGQNVHCRHHHRHPMDRRACIET